MKIFNLTILIFKHMCSQMSTILSPSENFTHFKSNMKSRLISPVQSLKCKKLDAMLKLLHISVALSLLLSQSQIEPDNLKPRKLLMNHEITMHRLKHLVFFFRKFSHFNTKLNGHQFVFFVKIKMTSTYILQNLILPSLK